VLLTRGNPAGIGAMTSSLFSTSESFTAIIEATSKTNPIISQLVHHPGSRSARMVFLLPENPDQNEEIPVMLDFLSGKAGEMDAANLLAEIEETSSLFEFLRRAGFSVYGWEKIWKLPQKNSHFIEGKSSWSKPTPADDISIRSLYQTLVPPLVQNSEPFTTNGTPRLVYRPSEEITAYVECKSGPLGIYLIPLIHPSIIDPAGLLADLAAHFVGLEKPVYIQVRSYQSWLDAPLSRLGAESSCQFSLMVKRLAIAQKALVSSGSRNRVEQVQAKPTSPIVQNFTPTKHSVKTEKSG
jgi:hypothetical protein